MLKVYQTVQTVISFVSIQKFQNLVRIKNVVQNVLLYQLLMKQQA